MQDEQPKGLFNRGGVVLFLVFTIPALLTLGAMVLVIMQGRVPGGVESHCERQLADNLTIRLTTYAYQSGYLRLQDQSIDVMNQDGNWQQLVFDTVQLPVGINCESNILELGTGVYLLYTEKTVVLSDNHGASWQSFNVCDEPRPSTERCDVDPFTLHNINFDTSGAGSFTIRESVTDDYDIPIYEGDVLQIAREWTITTSDAGRSWQLSTD